MGGAFFMNLDNIIRRVEGLKGQVYKEAQRIVKQEKDVILDYIREKQLREKGIDGTGAKITPEYKPITVAIKRKEGKIFNHVTLFDTGSFYDKMDLLLTDQFALGVFSRDSKTPDLLEKYGFDIFTFTEENRKEIDEEIVENKLYEWLTKQLEDIIRT